jgi:hypothetical protein
MFCHGVTSVALVLIRAHLTGYLQGFTRHKYKRTINTAACVSAVFTVTAGLELGFSATLKPD